MQREESTAYGALSRRALRVLAALDVAIARGGGEARVSYISLMNGYHVDRGSISKGLKQVVALGFVDVKPGPRLANIFGLSQRWRSIDAAAAARIAEIGTEESSWRAAGSRKRRPTSRNSKLDATKSETIDEDTQFTVRKPSLPRLTWLERRLGG